MRVDVPVLATYVGDYEVSPGNVLTVSLVEDTLMLTRKGEAAGVPLWPVSRSDFVLLSIEERRLSFTTDPKGGVTGVVLHRGENRSVARKVR